MPVAHFSFANICLMLISAGLIAYFCFLWQVVKQKTSTALFAQISKPVSRFFGAYAIYFAGISLLAANRFFDVITMPPRFLVVFIPLCFITILLTRLKTETSLRFAGYLPPAMLIGVHVYRLFIELVFVQFAAEKIIPAEMSIHGRNLDLWIGVLALPVAFLFRIQHSWARKAGAVFNILGLVSLANIFTIVVPSMPSPFRVYDTLYLPTYFPGVLIVFLASFAIFLHVLSLRQLIALKGTVPVQKQKEKPLQEALELRQ